MTAGRTAGRCARRIAGLGALLLLLAACGRADALREPLPRAAGDDRLAVVSTMSVIAELARLAGGEDVVVHSLTPVGGDPHTHEPSPSDVAAIAEADLVLDNGLGLSPWFEPLADAAGGPVLRVGEAVRDRLGVDVAVDDEGDLDPHLWMVPPTAAAYVAVIADALAALDPVRAEAYATRAHGAAERLAALDAELQALVATVPPADRLLVTSHDAYGYYAAHYGIEVVGSVVGTSTEQEPSARAVAGLIDTIRQREVPTVFLEVTVNPALLTRVARDSGARIGDPLYGDSVGPPGSGADDYAGMLRATTTALVRGWTVPA